jgi:hypothetical protein
MKILDISHVFSASNIITPRHQEIGDDITSLYMAIKYVYMSQAIQFLQIL